MTRICMKDDADPQLRESASDAQVFIIGYASRPISNYTPHIYISALPFAPFLSHYFSRFRGLLKISGKALERVDQTVLNTWESDSLVTFISFLPKGDRIVLGKENGELVLQNIHDGKYIFPSFKAHGGPITSIEISHDRTQIVTGSNDTTLSIWNTHDGSFVSGPFKGHTKGVASVSFSPDTMYIASGSQDCIIGFWVSQDATAPMGRMTGHREAVNSVTFSPCGTRIVSGSSDHSVRLWDIFSRSTIFTLEGHQQPVMSTRFISNGTQILSLSFSLSASSYMSSSCDARVWDIRKGTLLKERVHQGAPPFALSAEGDRIVGMLNGSVTIQGTYDGKQIASLDPDTKGIMSIRFSPDSTRLASIHYDRTIRIWHMYSALPRIEMLTGYAPMPVIAGIPRNVVLAPNQTCIATGLDGIGGICAFNLELCTTTEFATQADLPIEYLQFSLDTTRIVSLDASRAMHAWNAHTGRHIDGPHRIPGSHWLLSGMCTVCGTRIAIDSGDIIEIWDVQYKQRLAICYPVSTCFPQVNRQLAFSKEGNKLLISDLGIDRKTHVNTISVWDADSGHLIAGPISIPNQKTLNLSPDGTHVVCFQMTNRLKDRGAGNFRIIDMTTTEVTVMLPGHELCVPEIRTREFIMGLSADFCLDGLHVACVIGSECYIWDLRDQTVVTAFNNLSILPHSISYTPDGWCLVSGSNVDEPFSLDIFQARRFRVDGPAFTLNSDGWAVDARSQPLFWVAAEIRYDLPRLDGVDINGSEISFYVKYSDMLVGDDWSKCYIGD